MTERLRTTRDIVHTKMKKITMLLAFLLLACLANAASKNVDIYVGETVTEYLPSTVISKSPYRTNFSAVSPTYADIKSHTSSSVTIIGKKAFSSRVIIRCDYYYTNSNGLSGRGFYDYNVLVKAVPIRMNQSNVELKVGEGCNLSYYATVTGVSKPSVTWKTSSGCVTVYQNGYIKGEYAGTATITAETDDGQKATCSVTVKPSTVYVTGVKINNNPSTMIVGETAQLTAGVTPSNATDKTVSWNSSKKTVAKISSSGFLTALSEGTTTITCAATDGSGVYSTCNVTVKASTVYVNSITLNKKTITLKNKETYQLYADVTPTNATDRSVKWDSYDKSIATVSSNGLVTAVSAGKTSVYCKSCDGSNIVATCSVTVEEAVVNPTAIVLNKTSASLTVGGTLQLTATVTPTNASDKTVKWNSSDKSVATVDGKGVVTAVKKGSAKITATTSNGLSAYCNVTVKAKKTTLTTLGCSTPCEMEAGETAHIETSYSPKDVAVSFSYKSSDTSVAIVDENGNITAVGGGDTRLTITEELSGQSIYSELHVMSNSWSGTYEFKGSVVAYASATRSYPNKFTVKIERDHEQRGYFVTSFLFDDKNFVPYNNNVGIYLGTVTGNREDEAYMDISGNNFIALDSDTNNKYTIHAYDWDAEEWIYRVKVSRKDNTITMGDFLIARFDYDKTTDDWSDVGDSEAYYYNLTGTATSNGIESVVVADGFKTVNGCICFDRACNVKVYDYSGHLEYSGYTDCVENLKKGFHIVIIAGHKPVKIILK